jgi:hypothetical protein
MMRAAVGVENIIMDAPAKDIPREVAVVFTALTIFEVNVVGESASDILSGTPT